MARIFGKALLAALVAAGTLVAAPAQARDRYHRGGDDDVAIAIGAGLVGLAIGAAIASDGDRHHYRDRRYYDGYYPRYRGGYYYDAYPRYRGYYRDRRDYRRDWRHDRRDYRRDRRAYRRYGY